MIMKEDSRNVVLTFGAAGGLLLLASNTSLVLALTTVSLLACIWLLDWYRGPTVSDHVKEVFVASNKEDLTASNTPAKEEQSHQTRDLLADIQNFSEGSGLSSVKVPEPVSGAELLRQELVVQDVEHFDKADLKKTETQEPLSGAELLRKELETKSLTGEVESFVKSELKHTVVEEKIVLPDQEVINQEKSQVELIGGIENFDVDKLSNVSTKEPLSGADLLKQELTHKAVQEEVEQFDTSSQLKSTVVDERNWLPDNDSIREEKEKVEHLAGIESFDKDQGLAKVQTQEPLTGAELLRHQLMTEELETFDQKSMKNVDVEEKNVLPDSETLQAEKNHENLLKGVEGFSHENLVKVKTPEPVTGAELLKQELTIKSLVDSVESFEPSTLKSATTEEKVSLPDADTIQQEKERVNLLKDLEAEHSLAPVIPKEPLSGAALLKQELTRQQVLDGVSSFNTDELKHSEVTEKVILPDKETIEEEKIHAEHLRGIGEFDQSRLTPVKVAEPLSGPEVSQQESWRSEIGHQVESFNRDGLKVTETEEKVVLPDSDQIHQEKTHMDLLTGVESAGGVGSLKPVDTREPTNPLELAKMELGKDQVEEDIQAFDRSRLTPVVTEEKHYLPTAEDIKTEALNKELDTLEEQELSGGDSSPEELRPEGAAGLRSFLESGERERRSSSEEWEKVSTGDVGDRNSSSEC